MDIDVTVDADQTVTANYVADPVTVTLSVDSSGASDIPITSITGHTGTTDYTRTVVIDTEVTLTAPASWAGKIFTGWTGSETSSEQTVTLTVDAAKELTANYQFGPVTYTLSIYSRGARGVTIATDSGLDGTTRYSQTVTDGAAVTLTAPAVWGGRIFVGWSGAVSSAEQTVSFDITADKSITANYVRSACDPSTVYVDAIVPRLLRGDPGGWSFGYVTIRILDDCGDPVPEAVVTGTFTDRFEETLAAVTNAHGIAVFTTTTQVKDPSYTFCVDAVDHAVLTYNPDANTQTCVSY